MESDYLTFCAFKKVNVRCGTAEGSGETAELWLVAAGDSGSSNSCSLHNAFPAYRQTSGADNIYFSISC